MIDAETSQVTRRHRTAAPCEIARSVVVHVYLAAVNSEAERAPKNTDVVLADVMTGIAVKSPARVLGIEDEHHRLGVKQQQLAAEPGAY